MPFASADQAIAAYLDDRDLIAAIRECRTRLERGWRHPRLADHIARARFELLAGFPACDQDQAEHLLVNLVDATDASADADDRASTAWWPPSRKRAEHERDQAAQRVASITAALHDLWLPGTAGIDTSTWTAPMRRAWLAMTPQRRAGVKRRSQHEFFARHQAELAATPGHIESWPDGLAARRARGDITEHPCAGCGHLHQPRPVRGPCDDCRTCAAADEPSATSTGYDTDQRTGHQAKCD